MGEPSLWCLCRRLLQQRLGGSLEHRAAGSLCGVSLGLEELPQLLWPWAGLVGYVVTAAEGRPIAARTVKNPVEKACEQQQQVRLSHGYTGGPSEALSL